jgi:hypothetical protein
MQVGAAARQLPGWVDLHAIWTSHDTDKFPFGECFPTANAGSLGHMFMSGSFFGRHQNFSRAKRRDLPIRRHRAYASCAR